MGAMKTDEATGDRPDENRVADAVLLKTCDVAAMMRIGVSTLDRMRKTGEFGPRAVKVGGSLRWNRREVEEWLARPTPAGDLMDATAWPPVWADLKRRQAK